MPIMQISRQINCVAAKAKELAKGRAVQRRLLLIGLLEGGTHRQQPQVLDLMRLQASDINSRRLGLHTMQLFSCAVLPSDR